MLTIVHLIDDNNNDLIFLFQDPISFYSKPHYRVLLFKIIHFHAQPEFVH